MNIEEVRTYCLEKPSATESLPFNDTTLVFKVGGKIFLLVPTDAAEATISLKNTPEKNLELRAQYPQITGAYHMNKTHWNSVELRGLSPKFIRELIDESYALIINSLPKKIREYISNSGD